MRDLSLHFYLIGLMEEDRIKMIKYLISEKEEYRSIEIPKDVGEQKRLLRSLLNVREPRTVRDPEFLEIQDRYLKMERSAKGITDIADLQPVRGQMYIWQGDITTLRCDAIVNAANSALLGCFAPCHACIDNAIHTFSGVQLRLACHEIMEKQGHDEPTGQAKITPAFNLPCKYVIHTVGPIVYGQLTDKERNLLESCYRSCLKVADENKVESIAFCCISTGEFRFPNREAAEIAVKTVEKYLKETNSGIKVIFNVFKDVDLHIYQSLFGSS